MGIITVYTVQTRNWLGNERAHEYFAAMVALLCVTCYESIDDIDHKYRFVTTNYAEYERIRDYFTNMQSLTGGIVWEDDETMSIDQYLDKHAV